jgi:hypothetical protein
MREWKIRLYRKQDGKSLAFPHPSLRATFSQGEKEKRIC